LLSWLISHFIHSPWMRI